LYPPEDLSKGMRQVSGVYTQQINRRHRRRRRGGTRKPLEGIRAVKKHEILHNKANVR